MTRADEPIGERQARRVTENSNSAADYGVCRYAGAVRVVTTLFSLVAILWAILAFPSFWRLQPIEETAAAIINRESFRTNTLDRLIPAVQQIEQLKDCDPEALHSTVIIRLRLAENAMADGERFQIDRRLKQLDAGIRRSLACTSSDAFLWMILVWLDDAREGFRPAQLTYLRLSYQLGRNEGYIAARRNRLALSMFSRLSPDLLKAAIQEFAGMVNSWISSDAVAVLCGPGWPIRDRLLASLKDVGERQREAFAKTLYNRGYDLAVPGVALPDLRPW